MIIGALLFSAPAGAYTVDLTATTFGTIDGTAIFTTVVPEGSSGSGVLDPFVRLGSPQDVKGFEKGYNTNDRSWRGNKPPYDAKGDLTYTHSLLRNDPMLFDGREIGGDPGTLYREFLLDVNQTGKSALAMVDLQIFIATSAIAGSFGGTIEELNALADTAGSGVIRVWAMPAGDSILIPYVNGSGKPEMAAYFPEAPGTDPMLTNMILWSKFGDEANPADAGYEEWGVRLETHVVPLPGAVWFLGAGLVVLAGIRRRMGNNALLQLKHARRSQGGASNGSALF